MADSKIVDREKKSLIRFRRVLFWAGEIFCIISVFSFLFSAQIGKAFMAALAMILLVLPELIEKHFHCRVNSAFYLFALLYALGPMLGHCYKLYYLVPGWDKLLHAAGGVMFAVLGAYLPVVINQRYQDDILLRVVFAVFFSVSVAAFWEFFEFSADSWFGSDMQNDTIINSIHSYALGAEAGVVGTIEKIDSVVVNGEPLYGYLDIGLIDTMLDMLIETFGAMIFAVAFALDKNRHPIFQRKEVLHDSKG